MTETLTKAGADLLHLSPACSPAGDEICTEMLTKAATNGCTEWERLMEPLPFFEGFRHFLQAREGGV